LFEMKKISKKGRWKEEVETTFFGAREGEKREKLCGETELLIIGGEDGKKENAP
jgi:hypothetical protein